MTGDDSCLTAQNCSEERKESIMASTSNPKQGRKRRVLTFEKKLDIIKELKGGKSQRCVSELHQVPKSTVAYYTITIKLTVSKDFVFLRIKIAVQLYFIIGFSFSNF